jgi:hypothetical protein
MTPEAVNAWFTPQMYILYLGSLFVGMIFYYQWKWAQVCKHSVLVLIQKCDGHGDFELAPQEGGSVSIRNHSSNATRLWPINELATIDVPYPGVGFIPAFLQKQIRMVIVSEEDWEPMTNRSPNMQNTASPDVIDILKDISERIKDEKISSFLTKYVSGLKSASTKEMIASPAVLGNLMHEKITEAVITVNKEMLDSLAGLTRRFKGIISPTAFYVCMGILAIISVFSVYEGLQMASKLDSTMAEIKWIEQSLNIPPMPQVPVAQGPQTNKSLIPFNK